MADLRMGSFLSIRSVSQMAKWKSCTVINRLGKNGDLARARTGLQFLSDSYSLWIYSAGLFSLPSPFSGLIVQSMRANSPSSEAAQKVGAVCYSSKRILQKPISPDPSCLNTLMVSIGIHTGGFPLAFKAYSSDSSIFLVSQMLNRPSSAHVMQWKDCPLLGFLRSGLMVPGMNLMSATKLLWDFSIYDITISFILVAAC